MKTRPGRYEFSRLDIQKVNYPLQMITKKRASEPQRNTSPFSPPVGTFGLADDLSSSRIRLQQPNFIISLIKTTPIVIHLRRRKQPPNIPCKGRPKQARLSEFTKPRALHETDRPACKSRAWWKTELTDAEAPHQKNPPSSDEGLQRIMVPGRRTRVCVLSRETLHELKESIMRRANPSSKSVPRAAASRCSEG